MRANDGFSLIEVMMYVGITGFITTIAFAYSISGLIESGVQSEIDVLKSSGRVSTIWSIASGVAYLNHGADGDEIVVTISKDDGSRMYERSVEGHVSCYETSEESFFPLTFRNGVPETHSLACATRNRVMHLYFD